MVTLDRAPIKINDTASAVVRVERKVPLSDLVAQHREGWKFEFGIGTVILRRIRKVDLDAVASFLLDTIPGYMDAINDIRKLHEKSKYKDGLDADDMARLTDLSKKIAPYNILYHMKCFVEPAITTTDEYHALMSALTTEEYSQLQDLLVQLTNPNISGKVDVTDITLASRYNIPIANDLTMENITAQQMQALKDSAEAEGKALRELVEG